MKLNAHPPRFPQTFRLVRRRSRAAAAASLLQTRRLRPKRAAYHRLPADSRRYAAVGGARHGAVPAKRRGNREARFVPLLGKPGGSVFKRAGQPDSRALADERVDALRQPRPRARADVEPHLRLGADRAPRYPERAGFAGANGGDTVLVFDTQRDCAADDTAGRFAGGGEKPAPRAGAADGDAAFGYGAGAGFQADCGLYRGRAV